MKNANTIDGVSRAGSGILALLMPGGMGLPVFRPVRWHMRLGVVLACTGAVANFGLLTLSGWLLAGAATAGLAGAIAAQNFNILLPATAVRFFATIRILARYLEKVSTHDTALRLTGRLRSWLYARLVPSGSSRARICARRGCAEPLCQRYGQSGRLVYGCRSPVLASTAMRRVFYGYFPVPPAQSRSCPGHWPNSGSHGRVGFARPPRVWADTALG